MKTRIYAAPAVKGSNVVVFLLIKTCFEPYIYGPSRKIVGRIMGRTVTGWTKVCNLAQLLLQHY